MEDSSWKKALDGALSKLDVSEMPERGVITQEGYRSAIDVVSEKIDQDSGALQKATPLYLVIMQKVLKVKMVKNSQIYLKTGEMVITRHLCRLFFWVLLIKWV